MKNRSKKLLIQKKILVPGSIFLLLGLLLSFYLAGYSRQQQEFTEVDQQYQQVRDVTKKLINQITKRADRAKLIKQLAAISDQQACKGDWWNEWQQHLPRTKHDSQVCDITQKKINLVTAAATQTDAYLSDEATIEKQIQNLQINSKDSDWQQKAQSNATKVQVSLASLKVGKMAEPIRKAASKYVSAITAAWAELRTASTKQDKNAYLAADTKLQQAYADLGGIADISDEQLVEVTEPLIRAISAL